MLVDDIALTLQPDIGPRTAIQLIARFGSVEALFAAPADELRRTPGVNSALAAELAARKFHRQAEQEVKFLEKYHIHPLVSTSPDYPALLRECADYPHVLYLKGDPQLLQRPMIAFAGTRSITSYGLKMCEALVAGVGRLMPGAVIVSGLSYGIDVACHRAALAAGVPTIAVLPHGMTSIYPSHHTDVARDIVRSGGALLTECHSTFTPNSLIFIQRNRIVAGLCAGTVIVEATAESGSLTTAELALGYDRCLMAVPGRATDRSSEGTNALIRGLKARMVCSAEEILRELGWEPDAEAPDGTAADMPETARRKPGGTPATLGRDEQGLLGCFRDRDILMAEELAELSGLSPGELAVLLLGLEMAGAVRSLPGNRYEKM